MNFTENHFKSQNLHECGNSSDDAIRADKSSKLTERNVFIFLKFIEKLQPKEVDFECY